jgi:hypothetical protein
VRKCIGFAKRWGFDRLDVANVYALRSTDPRALWKVADPVGPENDRHIQEAAFRSSMIVVACGRHAKPERLRQVVSLIDSRPLYCLRTNKDGSPEHPLYVPYETEPRLWRLAA